MRGRIIHYNGNDGKGLISADKRQYPFEIGQWQSETAPTLNAVVDFDSDGARPTAVRRVADEVLMREKAGELAGKLGAFGGAALHTAQSATTHARLGNTIELIGKPALIAHAVFVVGALFFAFIKIEAMGPTQSRTLVNVSGGLEQMGMSTGGSLLVWLAILSLAMPMFWRNRFAWLAMLLPLLAVLKAAWDIRSAMSSMSSGMGAEFSQAMAKQLSAMFHIGLGAYICAAAALVLAAICIKRFFLKPSH
jgi:hypothetical protein